MHLVIGPRKHLTEMNIDCKSDLLGVGENLIDHPIVSNISVNWFIVKFLLSPRFSHLIR